MKTKQYLFGTMLLCANAAFISCSSSDDEITQTPVEPTAEEVFTTITVGAPTIESDGASGKTRVAFEYSSGLNMNWQADDQIRITPSNEGAKKYTATGAGATTTFTGKAFSNPTAPYTITIGSTYSGETETKAAIDTWVSRKEIETTQTQAGNSNTAHLHRNYQALLDGVNTIENITFSQAWATAHENSSGSGVFSQSACLKLNFTLPILVSTIKKVVLTSSGNIFKTKNNGSSTTNTLTLNFTGLEGETSNYNLVGYFMLAAAETDFSNSTLRIQVFYGDGATDYIYRDLSFGDSNTLSAGTLGTFKLNNSKWLDMANRLTYTFNSTAVQTFTSSGDNAATEITTGFYVKYGKASGTTIDISEEACNVNFSSGSPQIPATKKAAIQNFSSRLSDFKGALSSYRSASWTHNYCRGTIALDVAKSGKLYVYAKTSHNYSDGRYVGTIFQNSSTIAYTEETVNATTSGLEIVHEATGAGTFHIYDNGSSTSAYIYAVEFIPYK